MHRVILFLATAALAFAQTPPGGPAHCYVEVQNVADASEIERIWETSWGSYDRNNFHRIVLKIRAGTVGSTGGPVQIKTYFIARRLSGGQLAIYGVDERTAVIPAAYFTEQYVISPELKSHVLNLATLGERHTSGAQHEGWIVSISGQDNRFLAVKASSLTLQQLFSSPTFSQLPTIDKSSVQR